MKKIIIAVDGYSSCGKSTMARTLARKIGYVYIDTGAMYRAVTLFCIEHDLISSSGLDVEKLNNLIGQIDITFTVDPDTGGIITHLNGRNVEKDIRGMKVSENVSQVAALPFVREALTALQRKMGKDKGIVMDGRDIGTVVFPDAELKIFVTASPEVRAKRRYDELISKGEDARFDEVLKNVEHRDYIDTHRKVSPLVKAEDAVVLDNSNLTYEQQDRWMLRQYLRASK